MMSAISDYFEMRGNLINGKDNYESQNRKEYYAAKQECREREINFHLLEQRIGANIINIESTFRTTNLHVTDSGYSVEIYEWVTIEYQYSQSNNPDMFSYGVKHDLLLTQDKYGVYNISEFRNNEMEVLLLREGEDRSLTLPQTTVLSYIDNYTRSYSPSRAVAYSNSWVGHQNIGGAQTQNPSGYNPKYYYENSDCANFVSQCLYEGGIALVSGGYSTGWYYSAQSPIPATPQCGNGGSGSLAWIQVAAFDNFWTNRGLARYTYSAIKTNAGDPVYWLNSGGSSTGHLMFCVGKNSAGVPILNAHNDDIYHMPATNYSSLHSLYTLHFAHQLSGYTVLDEERHQRTCSVCGGNQIEQHYFQHIGTQMKCYYCNYTR